MTRRPGIARPVIDITQGPTQAESLEAKIGQRIQPQPNGCWLWRGAGDRAQFTHSVRGLRKTIVPYRFVYETLVGPIPDDHVLHHECRTPGCCNPAHLTPLTPGDHSREHARLRRAG